jgi:subtilase family serine protease
MSYDTCERCLSTGQLGLLNRVLDYARDRHVSVFAAAGDDGPNSGQPGQMVGVTEPTSSPLVTGVGGTTFSVRRDGGYGSESAWDEDHGPHPSSGAALSATGGGFSARYARPGYQNGLSCTVVRPGQRARAGPMFQAGHAVSVTVARSRDVSGACRRRHGAGYPRRGPRASLHRSRKHAPFPHEPRAPSTVQRSS